MIKAVLFDYGGVLTEGGKVGSVRAMFARGYGVSPADIRVDGGTVETALCGNLSDDALVAAINAQNSQYAPVTTDVFVDNADIYVRSEPVYRLAARLRAAGIITGVFSNVFATSAAALRKAGCYDGFTPVFLSCEAHFAKPDRLFYQYVLTNMGLKADAVAFIDDKEGYLAPGRALGMHTLQAVDPDQIVRDTGALIAAENAIQI